MKHIVTFCLERFSRGGCNVARVAKFIGLIISGIGLVVWSESPVTLAEQSSLVTQTAQASEGFYDLMFLDPRTHLEVQNEPFGEAMILHAHMADASNFPADRGLVVFQYCSRPGPSNDINRVDEAPKGECDSGDANWARLASVPVDAFGNAELEFCCPRITPTIGFRFRYLGQGSDILRFTIPGENFKWGP